MIAGVGANFFRSEDGEFIAQALENPDPVQPYPSMLATLLRSARASGSNLAALSAIIRRPVKPMQPEGLSAITASVLLVAGRDDSVGANPEMLQTHIPNANLECLAGVEHLNLLSSPAFQHMATDFLGDSQARSATVSRNSDTGLHQIRHDLSGTVIEGSNVTLVRWSVAPDMQATPLHSHAEHEQFTIVISGSTETDVGDETLILGAGDVCRIAPGVQHGKTRALGNENAVLIDVFEPRREDYIAAAKKAE